MRIKCNDETSSKKVPTIMDQANSYPISHKFKHNETVSFNYLMKSDK